MNKQVFTFKNNAIWIMLKGKDRMVFPYALLELLWDCFQERKLCPNVRVRAQFFKDKVYCYFFDYDNGMCQIEWSRDAFIGSAKNVLNQYCENRFHIEDADNPYHSIRCPHAGILQETLKNLHLSRSYHQIFIEDIKIVDFFFLFADKYDYDTGYELHIGDICYRSFLSDWSTDFNLIRNEMEQLCNGSSDIHLHNDDSPVVLHCRSVRLFSGSTGWNVNRDVVKVTLHPDEFIGGPIRFGWCDRKQVLKELYLGFLKLCTVTKSFINNTGWDKLRLSIYNKIQSCIIENFLLGIKEDEYTACPRQRWISSVEEIKTDYDNIKVNLNKVNIEYSHHG